jgi:hypothetical protein
MRNRSWMAAVAVVGMLVSCAGIDRGKAEAYLGAVESTAQKAAASAEAACQRQADPAKKQALAAEARAGGLEDQKALRAAFDDLMQTKPPSTFGDLLKKISTASAKVHLGVARVVLSCDVGAPSADTPVARKDLESAQTELKELLAQARMSL